MLKYSLAVIIILHLIPWLVLDAGVLRVPADYASIQEGINHATNGDTVLVAPGTYYENINFRGKNIVVASHYFYSHDVSDIQSTIIDGGRPVYPDTGSCVLFVSGEDSTAVLKGFTVTHGTGTVTWWPGDKVTHRDGGGVVVVNSSPMIKNNFITNNGITTTCLNGGGIGAHSQSNPKILNNVIDSNKASFAAGISIFELSNATIMNNIVCGNIGGWQYGGGGMGVDVRNAVSYIENNTIVSNTANGTYSSASGSGSGGAIVFWFNNTMQQQVLRNNIIWGNKQTSGGQISLIKCSRIAIDAQYNLIEGGYTGTGNINQDPQFLGLNYLLSGTSPCVDAGDTAKIFDDVENPSILGTALWPSLGGLRNDMGAYGGPNVSIFPNIITPTEVVSLNHHLPTKITLNQNYPNPFNPSTTISFTIPSKSFVTLKIFDMLGREIATILSEQLPLGNYTQHWNAANISSGVYFYRLQAGSYTETKKLILLK